MANVVVIGSQWGDEGKGKIVDWLSEKADVVVRFQGGHNAGHTLVINNITYKLSLLPSGIVRPGKLSIIGNGVVIDPWALIKEIGTLRGQGVEISPENLVIAENATLILPLHKDLDLKRENALGDAKIGTTGRGIGPAYEDKVGRRAIRIGDLANPDLLDQRVNSLLMHHNALLRGLSSQELKKDTILDQLMEVAPKILPYANTVWRLLDEARQRGNRILFEGAQGVMLDNDHGTYPYVTSSNTVAGQAAAGSGQGSRIIDYVLGITKAYTTRVGSGPFPTEQKNDIGNTLGQRGREFGTVTGRKRRCGWLKVCVGYEIDGERKDYLPASIASQTNIQPIYEILEGWNESTFGARTWVDLPSSAIKYVKRIEELIEAPVALLSTSPEREDTIMVHDPFAD